MKAIYDMDHKLVGETIVCVARKIEPPQVVVGSSQHRTNRTVAKGIDTSPAEAYIKKVWRTVKDKPNSDTEE